MARTYATNFEGVSASVPQDLVTIFYESNGGCEVSRIYVMATDSVEPTSQQLQLRCRRLTSATPGSGGTTAIAQPYDSSSPNAGAQCHQNDTSKTTGTGSILWEGGCFVSQGLDIILSEPIEINSIGTTTAFVFELLSSPVGTVHLSGGVVFTERGAVGT